MSAQHSLFAGRSVDTNAHALAIAGSSNQLRPAQKRFNKLIKEIAALRERLAEWKGFVPRYQQRCHAEFDPLNARMRAARIELAGLFDAALTGKLLTKRERGIARGTLIDMLDSLLEEQHDDALAALAKRHGFDPEAERAQEMAMYEALGAQVFGVELGKDHGAATPEELAYKLAEKLAAEQAERAAQQPPHKPRKKSAKTLEREAQAERTAQDASKAMREIYRKLARELHPDRITDEADRTAKTELMQEANRAYEARDLLALLELQWRIEQIDSAHLTELTEERLRHFTLVLKEQADALRGEIAQIAAPFDLHFRFGPPRNATPAHVERVLDAEVAGVKQSLDALQRELARYTADLSELKRDIKAGHYDPDEPGDDLDSVLDAMAFEFAARRR